jgi:HAMP domain-containing protein
MSDMLWAAVALAAAVLAVLSLRSARRQERPSRAEPQASKPTAQSGTR